VGDDLRFLDVHKAALSPKRLIKQFESTISESFTILLDNSSSMYYGPLEEARWKAKTAINAACTLSLMASLVGIGSRVRFLRGVTGGTPPDARSAWGRVNRAADYYNHFKQYVLAEVSRITEDTVTKRSTHPRDFAQHLPTWLPRHHLVIISDFWFDLENDVLARELLAVARKFRGTYLIQVLADSEDAPPYDDEHIAVTDSESGVVRVVAFRADDYRGARTTHEERLRSIARACVRRVPYRIVACEDIKEQQRRILRAMSEIRLAR
jgi:hypothetical protein